MTSRARIVLSTSIWLHAIIIAPQNATRKQATNAKRGADIDRFETTNAMNAAQNGDRFKTAAVMIGCVLLSPMS